ncbi:MAG: TIR domain-containing protein [Sulfuricellaceae bacterium]
MVEQVFISYAHADNPVFDEGTSGWVSGFVDKLQKAIAMKYGGREVRCWMDFRLEPQRAVDEELRRRIVESKCIVAFMSPCYLNSAWCRKEMETFVELVGDGKANNRVFLVEILPTDRTQWHSGIQSIGEVKLWCNGLEQPEAMTLGWPTPNYKADKDYWKQLNRLADILARQMQNLPPTPPAEVTPAIPPPVSAAPAAKIVWIANPTDDMLEQRETLVAMLQDLGHRVLPADSYPHRQAEYRQALDGDLKQADLLVQLLGRLPGRKPTWSDARFVQLQAEAASAEAQRRNLPLRLWRLPEIDLDAVADPVYRALLQRAAAYDWDAFQQQLADFLADQPLPPARSPLGVVINADKPDRALGKRVQDMLGELEVDATLAAEPLPTQLPAEYRKHLEAQLDDSQGVLIVYGAAPPSWVQAQHAHARKVLALKRSGVWGALLDGPPEHKPDHGISARNLMLLNCRQGVAAGVLQEFVAKLGQGGARV